ncbi:MAG: type II toxin-antitoxin system VapC family toxin, partial [Bacteroidetes bacterium]|nr:type II toxin-antitoxin system VapC family toxin [Bacteroidota bacterium]
ISLNDIFEYIDRNQIEIIPINFDHLLTLAKLPNYHNDPFDRLIISQALAENLVLITKDNTFKKYQVKIQWA